MAKRFGKLLPVIGCFLLLAACSCSHSWVEATCTAPRTCSKCSQIQGFPADHSWVEADCETPVTCENCGKTEGEPLGHSYLRTPCTGSCTVCGAEDPAAAGHSWQEASCVEPRHCNVCGIVQGDALDHEWVEATCSEAKHCTRCGAVEGWRTGHVLGVLDTGAVRKNGTCTVCDKLIENFYHRDKIYGWTEYEPGADGSYVNPITYVRRAPADFNARGEFVKVQWFEGQQQKYYAASQVEARLTCVAFYKDGKVYYFPLNEFNNAPTVKQILMDTAGKYISFERVSFDYYDGIYYPDYTRLYLYDDSGTDADPVGYVRTAYDHTRKPYTVVVNDRTGEIWVENGIWKY